MSISITEHGTVDVIQLPSRLVMANAASVRKEIQARVKEGRTHTVLDLGQTSFMDSSGLSVLVSVLKSVHKVGGEVVLLNLGDDVRALVELTRMHEVFKIFGELQTACAHVAGGNTA